MASIGQLIRAVASASQLDESSVRISARYLRQAGLIGQRSTGAGAARMTSADAAALLIAVNATALLKDSVEAVRIYSALPLSHLGTCKVPNQNLIALHRRYSELPTLGDALAATIELYYENTNLSASVEFLRPTLQVFLRLYVAKNDFDDFGKNVVSAIYATTNKKKSSSDRYVQTVFGHKTIKSVATILKS